MARASRDDSLIRWLVASALESTLSQAFGAIATEYFKITALQLSISDLHVF
jgi:hypothetical protein